MRCRQYRLAAILTMVLGATQGAYGPGRSMAGAAGAAAVETPGSSLARGMGIYAAGAGQYNVQTAQARSINANTRMKYNE